MSDKLKCVLLLVCTSLYLVACSTTSPIKGEDSNQASFDEYGSQTSGLIDVCTVDNKSYFIVTRHLVNRYNTLIGDLSSRHRKMFKIPDCVDVWYGIEKHPTDKRFYLMSPLTMEYLRKLIVINNMIYKSE